MTRYNFVYLGYLDYINHSPYKHAPEPEPPKVPRDELSSDWQQYFDGFESASIDAMRQIQQRRKEARI